MATKYPNQIDNNISLPKAIDLVTEVKAESVNSLREAILAIENELGISPSAEFGTVRARLDSLFDLVGLTIKEDGTTISYPVNSINFSGNVRVVDLGNCETEVIIGSGGGGGSGTVTGVVLEAGQYQETIEVTADGQTSFTLSKEPLSDGYVQMFVNGIKQEHGVEYVQLDTAVSYVGPIPLITSDVVEFWYLTSTNDKLGLNLTIQDEGVDVETDTKTINFIGADVLSVSGGQGIVNVYIPAPDYLSHWNTNDGLNGSQFVTESITRTVTRISSPDSEGDPFKTGGWVGTDQDSTIDQIVTFTTPGSVTGFGGDSTMTVELYDADGTTVLFTYTTPAITSNGVYISPSGGAKVTISNYAQDSLRYSANASIEVNVGAIFSDNGLKGGRYHIRIIHTTDSATDGLILTYVQPDVFYDFDPPTPSISGTVSITETGPSVVTKHISGIEYYDLGSNFTINIINIYNHNNNTSRTSGSVLLRGEDYGLPNLDHSPFGLGSANFVNYDSNFEYIGLDYSKTDWEITENNYRYVGPSANITAQVRDAWDSSVIYPSPADEVLIDTYGITSDDLVENFDDENRRQDGHFNSGSTVGNWNSAATLGVDSISGNNEAIVFNGKLMAPSSTTFIRNDGANSLNTNWSNYLPNTGGTNPNYTSLNVPVVYYRSFVDASGLSRSSFSIQFTGDFIVDATTDLANSDLEITIYKISGIGSTGAPPTNTQPLFLHGSVYNFPDFDDGLTNGQVRINTSSGNNVQGTFGGFNMEDGIYCKIQINNSNIKIDSITFKFNLDEINNK